jgi:ABC-type spermidine/putrescine transport system permease subunit I
VFVLSLGFYITPTLLGGPDSVMVSQLISREVNETLNWPVAAAVSTLLLVATFGGVAIFNKVVGIDRLFR